MMKLYIGNKNYSSWSMRPWVLMRECDIPFTEVMVRFDSFDEDSIFKNTLRDMHPTATVPILDHNGTVIADSLAIMEYLGETFPEKGVWPSAGLDRHQARILTAVMHSGFGALRQHCIMNIEADLPEVGARLMREEKALRDDLDRLHALLSPHLNGHDYLFGQYCAADAFYAPVMSRIKTYHLPVSDELARYRDLILNTGSFLAWQEEALAEKDFLDFEEPYRSGPAH